MKLYANIDEFTMNITILFWSSLIALHAFSPAVLAETSPEVTELEIKDINGQIYDVSKSLEEGKLVTFVFWQTWCTTCRRESPKLARISRERENQIDFFGVISGPDRVINEQKVKRYVEKYQLPYPQIRDRDLELTTLYGVRGIPTSVVLGERGDVVFRGSSLPDNWDLLLHPHSEN